MIKVEMKIYYRIIYMVQAQVKKPNKMTSSTQAKFTNLYPSEKTIESNMKLNIYQITKDREREFCYDIWLYPDTWQLLYLRPIATPSP